MDSSLNYLNLLPDEMLLKVLLETDDLKTLSKWCQTSKRVNRICQDEGFWRNKYRKDFGIESKLMEGETWRGEYKRKIQSGINSPISAGFDHYGIIDQNGNLHMAGDNIYGQLGVGEGIKKSKVPIPVKFPQKSKRVISISANFSISGAVTEDGKVYIWGSNAKKLLFSYPSDDPYEKMLFLTKNPIIWSPTELIVPSKAIKIVVNQHGYIVLLEDSSIYFSLYYGRHSYDPVMREHLKLEAVDISLGVEEAILSIITKDHKLYMWGVISNFIEGVKSTAAKPMYIQTPEPVIKVTLGNDHVMVLSTTGNVYTFGRGTVGELGTGGNGERIYKPQLIKLPEKIVQIETYHYTSSALSDIGSLYMWGSNYKNKISSNLPEENFSPVEISLGFPINFISPGYDFTIAVSSSNSFGFESAPSQSDGSNDGVVNYWGAEL